MKIEYIDNQLVIIIPVTKDLVAKAEPSKSGKTKVLATTHGFTSVQTPHGPVSLSMNATVR
jgi:hypothetical protein